ARERGDGIHHELGDIRPHPGQAGMPFEVCREIVDLDVVDALDPVFFPTVVRPFGIGSWHGVLLTESRVSPRNPRRQAHTSSEHDTTTPPEKSESSSALTSGSMGNNQSAMSLASWLT